MHIRYLAAAVVGFALPVLAQSVDLKPGWITDNSNDCQIWNPYPQPDETVSWSGACSKGLASGYGVLQWFVKDKLGERYEGSLREGRPSGWGENSDATGNHYAGEWRDGMKSGHGTFTWVDGSRYEGQFIDDARNGQGVYTAADGSRYEGAWQKNKPHGYGKGTYKDGSVFEGKWTKGCFQEGGRRWALFASADQCGFK